MRYTIAVEQEVKKLAKEGKSLDYIVSSTGIPPKVIWGWCPELRPHDDVIKQSVKQRYHFIYPDYEAKISNAFSPFVKENISEKDWEEINKVIYNVLYEESLYVFKNVIVDPPEFTHISKVSEANFLDYLKEFWSESEYVSKFKDTYLKRNYNSIHYFSALKGKKLKDISKGDIELIHEKLDSKGLSASRIGQILKVALIPLNYAYQNGQILLEVKYPIPRKYTNRKNVISDVMISKLFNANWKSAESYAANLIAYYAGLQLRETRALRLCDIYTDGTIKISKVYINGGLADNPNKRTVKVPTVIIDALLKYTSTSPYKDYRPEDFIFYSENRNSPAAGKHWTENLKKVLKSLGEDTSHISFELWH